MILAPQILGYIIRILLFINKNITVLIVHERTFFNGNISFEVIKK